MIKTYTHLELFEYLQKMKKKILIIYRMID